MLDNRDTFARFSSKWTRNTESGCWEWNRWTTRYPTFRLNGRNVGAHRAAWELFRGPIPAGLQIDHLCRNTRCVNPDHLEPVDSRENTMRGNNQTARQARQTHCKKGHPLSGDNLLVYGGKRCCRACKNARQRARWHSDTEFRKKQKAYMRAYYRKQRDAA